MVTISQEEYALLTQIAEFIKRWKVSLYEGDCPTQEIQYLTELLKRLEEINKRRTSH